MARSKKGRKVFRSKNLYKKRPSKLKRVLSTLGLVFLVGALAFVGYSVAGPIMDYFNNPNNPSVTSDLTPDVTTTPQESQQPQTSAPIETTPEPGEVLANGYLLPAAALNSSDTLRVYCENAKKDGFTSVLVPLKNEQGELLYQSQLESVKGTDLMKGTMTIQEIVQIVKDAGLECTAVLSALKDPLAPWVMKDVSYRFADDSYAWLDDRPEKGGKQWADPFRNGTITYITSLTKELTQAGVTTVVYNHVMYPAFRPYDLTILSPLYSNSTQRTGQLVSLISKQKELTTPFVGISASDILADTESFTGTAEILNMKKDLADVGIVVYIDLLETGETLDNPSAAASMILTKIKAKTEGLHVIPCFSKAGLTNDQLNQVIRTAVEMEYENYLIN
jgi:signal recognition particle subunit SEC65